MRYEIECDSLSLSVNIFVTNCLLLFKMFKIEFHEPTGWLDGEQALSMRASSYLYPYT